VVKALDRKLLRDLGRLKGQAVTIALVVACGVATFLTFVGAYRSLVGAEQSFYAASRFAVVFASCKRAPEDLAPVLDAIPGVAQLETRVVVDATVDMPGVEAPIRGRLQSLPPGGPFLNTPRVTEGRLPAPDRLDEALVNEPFARAHGLRPGATVRTIVDGRVYPLVIAGLALSPEHVFAIAPGRPQGPGGGVRDGGRVPRRGLAPRAGRLRAPGHRPPRCAARAARRSRGGRP
jgi:putative ABC transport system permease protein